MCPAQALGDLGKCRPFGVEKSQAPADVGAENSILRNQVFALEEKALIYQAGDVRQCRARLLSRIINQHPSELVCRFTTDILAKRAPVLIPDFRILMVEGVELTEPLDNT
jgi:hypothetical protein